MNSNTPMKSAEPTTPIKLKSYLCGLICDSKDSFSKFNSNIKWEPLVAGFSGGVISTAVLHPFDLIKIRLQVNEGLQGNVAFRPQYSGVIDAATTIVKRSGMSGLYQGVVPGLAGAASSWGLYFFAYNNLKSRRESGNDKQALGAHVNLWLGAQAGVFTLLLTNPIWVTKTRLCLQYDAGELRNVTTKDSYRYKGMADCMRRTYKTDGVRGLYKGFVPGLFGVSHGALQFMTYEELKKLFNSYYKQDHNAKLGTMEYLACSALSKAFAASVTYPLQVVRSRLQDQHRNYNGVLHVIKETYRNEGFRGFFKGMVPGVAKVIPATCITFVVYEHLVQYLESAKRSIP